MKKYSLLVLLLVLSLVACANKESVNERKIEKKTKEVYLTYIYDKVKPDKESAHIKFAFDVENFKISSIKPTKLPDGTTVYSIQGEGDMIHKTLNENNNEIIMQKKISYMV